MTVALKLMGIEGHSTPYDGQYVKEFDPSHSHPDKPESEQVDGECWLVTTADIHEAMHFPSIIEAAEVWKGIDRRHPVRADGRPNRPLTAYVVTFDTVPQPWAAPAVEHKLAVEEAVRIVSGQP